MAATHGDYIIVEREPECIDHEDVCMGTRCHIKILLRVGPNSSRIGRYLKRYISYTDKGYEWNEDPKHVMMLMEATGMWQAKPQLSHYSKDLGKSEPTVLDDLDAEYTVNYRSNACRVLDI